MTARASVGTLSQAAINSMAVEYRSCSLAKHQEIISTDGIRGTHNHPSERTRPGKLVCSGNLAINPGPLDLDVILPLVTGSTKVVNSFALAESLLPFTTVVDRVTKVDTYTSCYIDTCTFKAEEGELLELDLAIEALLESTGASGTFAGTFNYQQPYMMYDGALTISGTAYQFKSFELAIHNNLKKDRFMNSVTRTDLPFMDRIVEATIMLPYTVDTQALRDTGATAESLSIAFTNGADSLTLATAAFQIEPISPPTPGRNEILIPLRGQFRTSGGGTVGSLTITNVST